LYNRGFRPTIRLSTSSTCGDYEDGEYYDVTATNFADAGLQPDTTYFYRVFASNAFGSSGPSNTAPGEICGPL
jgi:phosphodiesterase/alkaline phosphatase D-like protein